MTAPQPAYESHDWTGRDEEIKKALARDSAHFAVETTTARGDHTGLRDRIAAALAGRSDPRPWARQINEEWARETADTVMGVLERYAVDGDHVALGLLSANEEMGEEIKKLRRSAAEQARVKTALVEENVRLRAELEEAKARAQALEVERDGLRWRLADLEDRRITAGEPMAVRSLPATCNVTTALNAGQDLAAENARLRADLDAATSVQVWPLARVLAEVRCGSQDWSWDEEFADLDARHAATGYLDHLEQQIREHGITMPVLIGSDGRLWDGHHRLRIAARIGIGYVPVEIVPRTQDAALAHARRLTVGGRTVADILAQTPTT
jgi:hypothetical protein